ncbi:MAG: hypothetical protein CME35_12380 [Gramella sp.]|nr:hypothetical protein [Christiangramia sp.]
MGFADATFFPFEHLIKNEDIMNKYFTAIVALVGFLFISCSSNDQEEQEINAVDFTLGSFPQEWKLVGVEGSMIPNASIQSPEDDQMEIYVFENDHSFTKKKKINGEEITVSGSFSLTEEKGLKLSFDDLPESIEDNYAIISSCSSRAKTEYFRYNGKSLINNGWAPCDGPYLYFERVVK